MIKYISFDLDGTLGTLDFDEKIWLEEIPRLYSEKYKMDLEKAKEKIYADYFRALYIEKVSHWSDIGFWFNRLGLENWKKLIEDMKEHIFLYDESMPVLKRLKERYKLIILSNSNRKFLDVKIEVEGLLQYFEQIFSTSSDFGVREKSPEIYKKVCNFLEIKPEELVHIGDDYTQDYLNPRSIGVNAYYLDRTGENKGNNTFNSLKEFAGMMLK